MSDDNSFFAELQTEFLTESAFLLETYEESMMSLETGTNPKEDLTQIFRVAHSVKGGAAAVGLPDLSKFAHVVEDLLDLLRSNPELVNSNVISLLLQSGDELKKRITSLQQNDGAPWETAALVQQLVQVSESLGGKPSKHAAEPTPVAEEPKEPAPDNFFEMAQAPAAARAGAPSEDHTNHELLAELLAQLSPEDAAEFRAKEAAEQAVVSTTAIPAMTADAASASVATAASQAVISASPAAVSTSTLASALKPVNPSAEHPQAVAESTAAKADLKGVAVAKEPAKAATKNQNSSIKVDTARVDSVLDAVGELVVLKNQLVHDETVRNSGNPRLEAIVDQMDKTVRELYEKTLSIRMTPLKSLFVKIQRIVRDVSLTLDKPVDLQLIGEETEVERTVFELLGDPLVHLVRNAMDHGVEKKETRLERGKNPMAKVVVSAKQSGGNVTIDITDDGGGINREKVLKKALERNLIPSHVDPASIPDEQAFQFIFHAGFSTADKISDLSGRGVGLDVVKSNLDRINGKINIHSKLGQGTTFRLTIPLSTAITDGIVVAVDGARYILPIYSIREIVRVLPKDYTEISGAGKVANIRGALLPVIDVSQTLGQINWDFHQKDQNLMNKRNDSLSARREETMLVIIESMAGQMALPVDDVLGQAQVVVKPITTGQNIPEVAGAAILGDGRTVLILDPPALIKNPAKEMAA